MLVYLSKRLFLRIKNISIADTEKSSIGLKDRGYIYFKDIFEGHKINFLRGIYDSYK